MIKTPKEEKTFVGYQFFGPEATVENIQKKIEEIKAEHTDKKFIKFWLQPEFMSFEKVNLICEIQPTKAQIKEFKERKLYEKLKAKYEGK